VKLRTIAHSRTGDKGNMLNVSVIAFDPRDFPRIERTVTAARVREHFSEIIRGEVVRYALPGIGALNFVMQRPAGDTVTRTLALDAHGKSLSSAMLDLEIEDEPGERGHRS
jgi:hypothetical protein